MAAADIARILYGPPAPPEVVDPLAKLRAAHAGGLNGLTSLKPQEYGLIESLRVFTSVETLEGDNAFACHKCWKIKSGHYRRPNGADTSPVSTRPSALTLPSIAVEDYDAEQPSTSLDITGSQELAGGCIYLAAGGPVRKETLTSNGSVSTTVSTATTATVDSTVSRATLTSRTSTSTTTGESPRLASSKDSDPTDAEITKAFANAWLGPGPGENGTLGESSDGLSDSTDDEELPSGHAHFFRGPKIRGRRASKHFVLRCAFKRYLIVKAPEVLVFHIKRFKQTGSGVYSTFSSLKKLDDMVTFPETLDLAPFMAPNRTDFKAVRTPEGLRAPYMDWAAPEHPPAPAPRPYKLYAVVVHMGTMLSGHYIAYVLVDPEKVFPPQRPPPQRPTSNTSNAYPSAREAREPFGS